MDFGDYCMVEMKRYGGPNEWYVYKVIGRLRSNAWVDTPVGWKQERTLHEGDLEEVLNCVCCGVVEDRFIVLRASDCKPVNGSKLSPTWAGAR